MLAEGTIVEPVVVMIGQGGQFDESSIETRSTFRFWTQIDTNTQTASKMASAMVQLGMKVHDEAIREDVDLR